MKIKAKKPSISSIKLFVPIDGLIEVDKEGIADVSPKCAVQLVNGTNDWEYLKKASEEKVGENENTGSDKVEDTQNGDEINEIEEFKSGLKDMKLKEMKDLANEAGYPEEEWGKISSKDLMSAYLVKKLEEAVGE